MTVAGLLLGRLLKTQLKTVAVSVAGTADDSAADSAAGTAPITNLIDFQISVSDLLPSITLLLTFLSKFPHYYMLILQAHQVWVDLT